MKKAILIAGAGISALLAGPQALAQTASGGDGGVGVAEIVVTAQKREERLQQVPVAVSVVSGSAITNSGATNIEGV